MPTPNASQDEEALDELDEASEGVVHPSVSCWTARTGAPCWTGSRRRGDRRSEEGADRRAN